MLYAPGRWPLSRVQLCVMPTVSEQKRERKRKPGRPERQLKLHMTPEQAARAIFRAAKPRTPCKRK